MTEANHKIEFKVGQEVTYFPYEDPVRRVIVSIRPHQNIWGKPDVRVWYRMTNPMTPGDSIVTDSTGLCIKESIYFNAEDECHTKKRWS